MNNSITQKATPREWIGLAVIALPCLLYSMDLTVLMLAVPHLTLDLQPSPAQILWITDIYGFLVAGLLITMGTLGDRIGRRRLLLIGAACFGVGSVIAAFAPTAEALIAARALLGLAGATLAPSTLSLIRNMFQDDQERTIAIGLWVACFSAGGTLAPLIGGIMLQYFWWGSIFLIGVPVMALLLILGPFLLPESRDPNAGRLEIFSVLLSLCAILPVIFGIKKIAESGFDAVWLLFIAGGILNGIAFVQRQKKLADPLIDVSLFRVPGVTAALCINMMGLFILFGFFLLITQYLQLALGMSPLEAGLWTVPTGLSFVVGSLVTPALAKRFARPAIIMVSFLISAAGFATLTQMGIDTPLWMHMGVFVVICAGFSPIATLTTDLVIGMAPPERAGAASAISETSFEFGGAIGIAVIGSIAMVLYRSMMEGLVPADVPPEAGKALASAVLAASSLPAEAAGPFLQDAREAFARAMQSVAGLCSVVALFTAFIAMNLLRRERQSA